MGDLFQPVLERKQKLPKLPGLEAAELEPGIEIRAQAEEPPTKKPGPASKKRSRKI
jgi:hypothetical protein